MAPRRWSLHLVGDGKSGRAEATRAAGRRVQLDAFVRASSDISGAIAAPDDRREVLVLLEPTRSDVATACAAADARGLPRWAVVEPQWQNGDPAAGAALAWEGAALDCSIAFAISAYALRRENARLGGDLHTVARRLTHDLRTPLNSISAANEALASLGADHEPALHQAISTAVAETSGLIERVATVLLAGVGPIGPRKVDMEEIVWKARERMDVRLRSAGAAIIAPETWPVVSGVASSLEFIWMNLLANSVEHGGPKPRIELGWNRSGADTTFWVRDSGLGVPPAKRPHLFHPFDRLGELNSPRGYGLSLVQRLVELQGGTTGYDPAPAPAGTFYFTLPEPE